MWRRHHQAVLVLESPNQRWHIKGTVNKVVENSRHSVMKLDHLAQTLNIGLDKAKQIIRVTTQCRIRTAVHHMIRRYKIDSLDLCRIYISGIWYVYWMLSEIKLITQFRICVCKLQWGIPWSFLKWKKQEYASGGDASGILQGCRHTTEPQE